MGDRLELARDGASVIVSGRDAARGAETVAAIEAEGGTARFVAADLGDLSSVARLAEEAAGVDVLVNNAGVLRSARREGCRGDRSVGSTVPMNRPAAVEEIAHVVAFIASPRRSSRPPARAT
jgi:NAD(P)-dependent dehydrogenase (short-subunit alcohol dehydrogenase family)